MNLKHLCYYIVITLFVASCSGNKQSFTLYGEFKGLSQGEFLCYANSPAWASLDTIKVVDGKFSFSRMLTDTVIVTLQYPNFMQTRIIAMPGEKIKLSGDASNMKKIRVSGDEENDALSEFRIGVSQMSVQEQKAEAEKFIRANPTSWASLVLFEQYFVEVEKPDYAKLDELLTLMTKAIPERTALHVLAGQLSQVSKCRVGKRLPSFETVTLSGEKVNNAKLRGKTVLINFWSTMSSEYIYPVSNQRRLLRKFGNRVTQLNICLDIDTTTCCRVLRSDTIKGYNVCDLRSFGSPLVSVFGFRSLPSNILVDSTGVIRGRDIPPAELSKALASLGLK